MKIKRWTVPILGISALLLLLAFLTACGGAIDEAVEDTSDTDTEAVEDSAESETIADDDASATGSEEDSGELPPTPEPGSKVSPTRGTPAEGPSFATAVATPVPPANRTNSEITNSVGQIDLVLVIDATGSMATELNQLKASLSLLAAEISALPGEPALRYGLVIYRDQNKAESTELFALTDSWTAFTESLVSVTAVGGGDYPEALNNGLYQAIINMNWQSEADRLIILLGDAPPNPPTPDTPTLDQVTTLARETNITIHAIASDGIDDFGSAVFQQIAENNNGRFAYLTDRPEEAPAAATAVYSTANLPALLVEIITQTVNDLENNNP